jgi:two-component system, chemotaxis family, CheB/CheR fusion protein
MELDLDPVVLADLIEHSVAMVRERAASHAISLTCDVAPSLGIAQGDERKLKQVVLNLLTNAVKFTPEGGDVNVVVERAGERAVLRVSDNGRGIEPAFLPEVFRRFSQEDSSVTRAHGGLGLGLAIAHHLVELHGGTIRAESEGVGQGATFSVSLPLEQTIRERGARGASRPARPASDTSNARAALRLVDIRVLIVDDDPGTRDAVAEMLKGTGAEVRVVESAAEGLVAVEAFRPSVVLCDIAMPGEDGYSFIRRLRALEGGGAVPAVALTALAGEEDRRRALSAGFQMHVSKPVDINRLTQAVVDLAALGPAASPPVVRS